MKPKTIKLPRIVYSNRVLQLLKEEFGIGRKAVNDALTFKVISQRSNAIRHRAVSQYKCQVEYQELSI